MAPDTVELGMTYVTGHDRSQLLLLPEAVDDYVGTDNPVRFIDAFVDGLDLAAAGFGGVAPKVTGRPAYAPGDLLKLYIYGYLNRVRSSRRLEAETARPAENCAIRRGRRRRRSNPSNRHGRHGRCAALHGRLPRRRWPGRR